MSSSMESLRAGSPSSPSRHITVVDVYELSAAIGNDFERLIEEFGNGNPGLKSLIPKIISALETLEALASHGEKENGEISDLRNIVEKLQSEKQAKIQDRIKFEHDLEHVEDNYRREIATLKQTVRNLQAENRHLMNSVPSDPTTFIASSAMRDEDLIAIAELREESSKQKAQIRELQRDIDRYACEIDNLQNSVEKLIRQNEELLRKNNAMRSQGRLLIEEKSTLNARLVRAEETTISLRKALNETSRARRDQDEILMGDLSDSSPRFTLSELRGVLREKTELKGRVIELEEELERLRPRPASPATEASDETVAAVEDTGELLYGPINREPDEKLFPWKYQRKDSGVRKFFRFFKEGLSSEGSPRRRRSGKSPLPSQRPANAQSVRRDSTKNPQRT